MVRFLLSEGFISAAELAWPVQNTKVHSRGGMYAGYSVYELLDVKSFDLGQGRYREALLLTEVCSKCPGLSYCQCSNRKLVAPPPSDEMWMAMF
jgi:hypothetical protein